MGGRGELGVGEGFGVVDEVGGFVDQALYGVEGFAEAGVEAVAVEDVSSCGVAVEEVAHLGMFLGESEEGAGGVGGFGREVAGAGEDKGVDGAFGGAPSFVGGVANVAGGHSLEGRGVHVLSVGEYGCGVG